MGLGWLNQPHSDPWFVTLTPLHSSINKTLGTDQGYLYSGVDSLNALLDEKLKQRPPP